MEFNCTVFFFQDDNGTCNPSELSDSLPVGLVIKIEPADSFDFIGSQQENSVNPISNLKCESADPTETPKSDSAEVTLKYECSLCDEKCPTRSDLFNHRRLVHYKVRQNQSDVWKREASFFDSKNRKLGKRSRRCFLCKGKIISRSIRSRILHKLKHHEFMKCKAKELALSEYRTSSSIKEENMFPRIKLEGKTRKKRKRTRDRTGIFKCSKPNCTSTEIYTSKLSLYSHVKRDHPGLPYIVFTCPFCNEYFDTKEERKEHKRSCELCKSKYPCGYCGKKYALKKDWKNHVEGVHLYCPVKCPVCGKSFKNKKRMATHMSKAHGKWIYGTKVQ